MTAQTDDSAPTIAGAILAGGRSSRYGGKLKGLEEVAPGVSMMDREIRELTSAGLGEVIIVTNEPEAYRHCGAQMIPDLRPGLGPLGGIEAALAHYAGRYDATVLLPCDLPAITRHEIRTLVEGFVAGSARVAVAAHIFWEPLCTVVHNSLLAAIREALDEGQRSPGKLWRDLGAAPVDFADPAPFCNVNSPEDLARWQGAREEGP